MSEKKEVINLSKRPKNPLIIEGFPGFGLVGTIATEFLVNHLECELIGKLWFEEMPATIAIHESKIVYPIGIYYNKKYNIIIIHAITATKGIEWKTAKIVADLAKELKAIEVIGLEGVGSNIEDDHPPEVFYYTNKKENQRKLDKIGIEPLREGIIMGITSSLLLNVEDTSMTALFAETHTNLPDSKAAAKLIEVLDKYLGLKVDYKPLLETAEEFEGKLKTILEQGKQAQEDAQKKQLSYVG